MQNHVLDDVAEDLLCEYKSRNEVFQYFSTKIQKEV